MKLRILIPLLTLLVGSILFCLWIAFRAGDEIEWRKQAWLAESKENKRQQTGGGLILWDELKSAILRHGDPYQRRYQKMREHERALFRLGYLTNHDLFVTNQVLTREFRSNFIRIAFDRFGTNGESIWMLRGSTNQDGYHATLPAQDVREWERIFRECAARYASNVPPSLSTNSPSQ